jgi:hypothetical protein
LCSRPRQPAGSRGITTEEDRTVAEVHSEGTLRIRGGRIAALAEHFNALIVQEKLMPPIRAETP